ncbi:hypothetical protein Gohar_018044 [Gossypium harknessii]|uniref:Uncharacterized protein n=1 Tax=Gossypium harknessii TaxID=34285 RepID=A0A7J9GA19_9ROSI|nr:hypothetical protein [Gossypium harknessii]
MVRSLCSWQTSISFHFLTSQIISWWVQSQRAPSFNHFQKLHLRTMLDCVDLL